MKNYIHFLKTTIFSLLATIALATAFAQENAQELVAEHTIETLRLALAQNNPEIGRAAEDYKKSLLDLKDAKAGLGPQIDLQISATYMMNPPVGSLTVNADDIINAVQWPSGIKPSSTGQYIKIYDGMEKTFYNISLTMQQPVFTWGKLTNAVKIYDAVSKIQATNLSSTEKKLATELETRLASLAFLAEMDKILDEEKTYADELVSFSEDGEKNGMILHQDVLEAKIKAKELDIAKQTLQEQIQSQLIELRRQTGIEDLSTENIKYEIDEKQIEQIAVANRAEIEKKALDANQDSIKMVTQLKDVAALSKKIAKNSVYWKPDFALQATAGYGGSRVPFAEPNWMRKDDYTVNFSLGMKTTVWDGGKKLHDVTRKISESEIAQINADAAASTIKKTLAEQWNTLDLCKFKIEYQDLKIETAQSKIAQQEVLFQNGYGSRAELLNAKIDWCNARLEKQQQALKKAVACYTIMFLVK